MIHICQDEILAVLNMFPHLEAFVHHVIHWFNVHVRKIPMECEHEHECCEENEDAN